MRMNLPPKKLRARLTKLLLAYYRNENPDGFKVALNDFCAHYRVKRPKVQWVPASKLGKNAALTFDNGVLHLITPVEWGRMPSKYDRSPMQWIFSLYHEFYHFLHWVNDENKADEFARKMLAGIEGVPK